MAIDKKIIEIIYAFKTGNFEFDQSILFGDPFFENSWAEIYISKVT